MITTSCGFLALYQHELVDAVSVPFLSSALLQVPHAARVIHPDRAVGILTMSSADLTEAHYEGVGWSSDEIDVAVSSFAPGATFWETYLVGRESVEPDVLEEELVDLAGDLLRRRPDVGALVLECTNFVPFAPALRRVHGLPVFDLSTLVLQTHMSISGTDFEGA